MSPKSVARWVTFLLAASFCVYSFVVIATSIDQHRAFVDSFLSSYKSPWLYPLMLIYFLASASSGLIAYLAWRDHCTLWMFALGLYVLVVFLGSNFAHAVLICVLTWYFLPAETNASGRTGNRATPDSQP